MKLLAPIILVSLICITSTTIAAQPQAEIRVGPTSTVVPHNGTHDGGNINQRQYDILFRVANIGNQSLVVTSRTLQNATNCTSGPATPPASIAPGANWGINMAIYIAGLGSFSIEVHIASNDPVTPNYIVTLAGTGMNAPHIRVQTDYNGQPVAWIPNGAGQAIGSSFVPTSANSFALHVSNDGVPGSGALQFAASNVLVVQNENNCNVSLPADPSTPLNTGDTPLMLNFQITPAAAGPFSFQLYIDTNDWDDDPWFATFNGTATNAPVIRIYGGVGLGFVANGATRDMGEAIVGQPHGGNGSIGNNGTATLNLTSSPTVQFQNETNCAVTLTTEPGSTIAVAGSEAWAVSITCPAVGAYSFQFVVASNDPVNGNYVVTFTGDAVEQPTIQVTQQPAGTVVSHNGTRNLPGVQPGDPFEVWYEITNVGGQNLLLNGSLAIDFVNFVNCTVLITAPTSTTILTPGSATEFRAEITPTASGPYSCQFIIASNDPATSAFIYNLSGGAPGSGGDGGGGDDEGCSTGGGTGWMMLLGLLAVLSVSLRLRRA